jgi:hypothetical protein
MVVRFQQRTGNISSFQKHVFTVTTVVTLLRIQRTPDFIRRTSGLLQLVTYMRLVSRLIKREPASPPSILIFVEVLD